METPGPSVSGSHQAGSPGTLRWTSISLVPTSPSAREQAFSEHDLLPGYRRVGFRRDNQGRKSRSRQSTKAVGFDVELPSPILATRKTSRAFLVNRKGDGALASARRTVIGFAWLVNTAGDGD